MKNQLAIILLVLVSLMTAPVWAQSYPVTDSFSGSGALSSSWTNTTAGYGLTYPPVPLLRSSSTVVPNTAASWGLATYTGETFTANQYAQVKFVAHSTAGGATGPCVQMSVGGTGYCYAGDDGAIIAWYTGDWWESAPGISCPVPATGDTIQLSVSGSTLTCSDITKGTSASGSTISGFYANGNPGLLVDTRNSSVYALTSFQADCVPTCGTTSTVATPTFSPAAGSYSSAQTVTISDSTSGATIHYTTDGSTPTASSTTYSSPITVAVTETVKAIGVKSGYTTSAVGSAAYTITSAFPVTDSFSGSGALSSNWTNTTASSGLTYPPVPLLRSSSTVVPNTAASWGLAIYTAATFTANQYAQVKFVAHSTAGGATGPCVQMSVGGTGYCYAGDDGAIIAWYVGDWWESAPGISCPIPATGDTIQLSVSGSTLTCSDITKGTSASGATISGFYANGNPGLLVDTRNSSVYALTSFQADCVPTCGGGGGGTVATPTFSPAAGTYTSAQTVTISDSTSGATIHYTTDGSTPTGSSTTYTAPINVSTSETVKAIGVLSGYTNSAVGSAAYIINMTVATPTFSPGAGTYTSAQTVTISDGTSGATIHYTTDGTTPTTSSTTYSSPITVSVSETVKALGAKSGYTNSAIGSAAYTIGSGHTWYVRPDGGTRYSTNVTNGQCNGMYDAAYPGSGVNQNCAFNQVRMLYQDGSYTTGDGFPGWGWVIAGGDTVIIRGSIGTGVSYRVGYNSASTYCDDSGCWGIAGNPYAAGMPPPPSGTSAQHTRILGENYAACTSQSARTQIHGGWAAGAVLSLSGSSYVDAACLDLTDFSNCGRDTDQVACESNGTTVSDFANNGITLNNTSTHITLTDIRIHGLASDGMHGATGDGFVAKDLAVVGNADAGWNADDGSGTTGVGSLLVQNFDISWNGCVEEYPIVDTVPYFSCRDQSSGGYGDGFGTATVNSQAPGWQVHFDQGTVSYNTQDGLDALHIGGPGSTMTDTRVLAFGNEGQQLKVGGATATIQNSVIVGNCDALLQTIPGRPNPTYDQPYNTCRAGDTAVVVNVTPGDPAIFQDNTVYTDGAIGLEVEYATGDQGSTNTLKYNNNIFVGFLNSGNGENPTPIYSTTDLNMLTNPGASWTNNSYFGYRSDWSCPTSGESAALCSSPELTDMTYHAYGYGNVAPASEASPVVGAGIPITGLTTDYKGATRSDPPTIGACETTATCP